MTPKKATSRGPDGCWASTAASLAGIDDAPRIDCLRGARSGPSQVLHRVRVEQPELDRVLQRVEQDGAVAPGRCGSGAGAVEPGDGRLEQSAGISGAAQV